MSEGARKMAAEIWQVPVENIDPKPTYHTVEMFRALDRGDIRFMWVQVTKPIVTMSDLRRYRDGAEKDGRFMVVSEISSNERQLHCLPRGSGGGGDPSGGAFLAG